MQYGDELVDEPFQRLIHQNKLLSWEHKGLWASMDTFKDKQTLDDAYTRGNSFWEVWRSHSHTKAITDQPDK
jgi:glucose-1-phosphate cytidylyltransferase